MDTEIEEKRTPYVVHWRDGFKINVPQIDQEHKHLFFLLEALNLENVEATVDELLDYVVIHFTNEQAMMEKSGYPEFREHLKLHEQFGATVADFLSNGEDWSEDRVQDLRRFLNKWLIGHIMTHDLRFGKWYENQLIENQRRVHITSSEKLDAHSLETQKTVAKGFFSRIFGR